MRSSGHYQTIVLFDPASQRVLATGTLMIEQKFILGCGVLGHIEDIVVHPELRGLGFGQKLILLLIEKAKDAGCYKVTLDCDDSKIPFYEKTGLTRKGNQMAYYFQRHT